ncbi:unnamed protein product [Cuscuta campestris]|uniref:DUF1995 domain-containing protein n=1 Tax=Cuscuta campestris TaxID=132261 RepID=A0A484KYY8_9ASTE|nr:unnamed protein product [Cuscuta campestris]
MDCSTNCQMVADLVKYHQQSIHTSKSHFHFKQSQIQNRSFFSPRRHDLHLDSLSVSLKKPLSRSRFPLCALSSPTPPPRSREEAISQARDSLCSTLEKLLSGPKLVGRIKKVKPPRFRVEIPVNDDSPESLSRIAVEVFENMPIRRKGSNVKILILWPDKSLAEAANTFLTSSSSAIIENLEVSSVTNRLGSIRVSNDVIVFLAPEPSQVEVMKDITGGVHPKPVVIFNPKWGFEEEGMFRELREFVGSFETVYSFIGLEVRGVLSRRKGAIFKCGRDGRWNVLVEEEEEEGEWKMISTFKTRPSITEVESVLYNLMAMNSPLTRSAKFLKGLVSRLTGKS